MDAQISTAFAGIITMVITVLGGFSVKFINQYFSEKKVSLAKEFASDAVNHIEEIAPSLWIEGAEKFKRAIISAKDLASKVGINLSDDQWETILNSALQQARGEWALVKGKTEAIQPVVPSEVAPEVPSGVVAPADASVPDPDPVASVEPIVPANPTTPVAPPSAIQSILEAATQAGQAAYQQVVQDSIQALSATK